MVRGVTEVAVDGAPDPPALIARSCTAYVVPLMSPEMTRGVTVFAGLRVVQVTPPSVEYS